MDYVVFVNTMVAAVEVLEYGELKIQFSSMDVLGWGHSLTHSLGLKLGCG